MAKQLPMQIKAWQQRRFMQPIIYKNLKCHFIYFRAMGEYSIGDAMKNMLKKSNLRNGVRAVQIEEIWEATMGKTIAKYTQRIKIINQTLFISTNVGPLKNELMYQKPQIIKLINEAFGEKVIAQVVVE